MYDFASRVHNHNYHLDPIVRSLLDTDFYKFLMHQYINFIHPDIQVEFKVKNRSKERLADIIKKEEIIEQFEYVKKLRFQKNELIWLSGNKFYGEDEMFTHPYIKKLENFNLSDYSVELDDTGNFDIRFFGNWFEVTLWEIYALSVINTLRNRAVMRTLSRFELDVLYSKAKTKLWNKLQSLKHLANLNLTDFGTRRRHDFLFQEWAVLAAQDALGVSFTGTSNTFLAMKHSFEAKGTNAHELPMVIAALANTDEQLRDSQYDVCLEWQQMYRGALLIGLIDTFGSTQFLKNAPDFLLDWTGIRFDSKDPIKAGEEAIRWWKSKGVDPKEKLGIFSDGLDEEKIIKIHSNFKDRMKVGFGFGTNFTNDFRGCLPNGGDQLGPISLVCKVSKVNGRDAVKLSDNLLKSMGPTEEKFRYIRVFGTDGMEDSEVVV